MAIGTPALASTGGGGGGGGDASSANQALEIAQLELIEANTDSLEGVLTTIDADTGNIAASVASIDTKTPALGQALAAGSVPIVLTAAQLTTLTPLATVAVTQSGTWDEVGINDSGNSITVDNGGTFAVQSTNQTGDNTIGRVKITDGTDVADVLDLANSNPVTVAIVDGSGDQITSFGGGTQYTEDAAAAANPVGTALMLVREDGRAGSLTTTDGDNVAARGNNKGELYVKTTDSDALLTTIDADTSALAGAVSGTEVQVDVLTMPSVAVTNAGTFAVQVDGSALTALQLIDDVVYVDDADWTDDTSKHALVGGVYQSAPHTVTDGDVTPFLTDVNGRLIAAVTDNGGSLTVDNAGLTELAAAINASSQMDVNIAASGATVPVSNAGLTALNGAISGTEVQVDVLTLPNVTNAGTFAVQVDGNALTSLQLIDDVVYTDDTSTHSTGTSKGVGVMAVAVPTDTSISANDIGMVGMSTDRRLYGDVTLQVADADVSATNAVPTKGVPSDIDINGSNANHAQKYYTSTGAVTDGIIWSPAAGKRWHVLTLYIQVSAAATVTIEDDLAGGDSAVWKGELAANSGVVLTYDKEHPFSSTEDAADLIITTSAGNVYVQAVGYEV